MNSCVALSSSSVQTRHMPGACRLERWELASALRRTSARTRSARSRTRWRGAPPKRSLKAMVACTALAAVDSTGVRASSDAARPAVSFILPGRPGDREEVGLQLEHRVAVACVGALDDIAERREGLVQRARVIERLAEPQARDADLVGMLGERERLAEVLGRAAATAIWLSAWPRSSSSSRRYVRRRLLGERALQILAGARGRAARARLRRRSSQRATIHGSPAAGPACTCAATASAGMSAAVEHARGLEVQPAAPRGCDLALDGRSQDRMREPARRDGPQQPDRQQRVRGDRRRHRGRARSARRSSEARRSGSSSATASATVRASFDRRPMRASVASMTACGVSPSIASTSAALPRTPSSTQRPQQLDDIERRTRRRRVAGRAERSLDLVAEDLARKPVDGVGTQRLGLNVLHPVDRAQSRRGAGR